MTTVQPERPTRTTRPAVTLPAPLRAPGRDGEDRLPLRVGVRRWVGALREALDRPLTTYYLLLGSVALLLTIGLIMVLSASSVYSFRENGDSYAVVRKQLIWVAIGLPAAWSAAHFPHVWVRRLAYPVYGVSLLLLALTAFIGVEINGNQNWLALGPVQIQPSEIAKFAMVLWAANILANKERRLGSVKQMAVPVVPGMLLAIMLVLLGRDVGTALVFLAIMVGMLWVVGLPLRYFLVGTMAGAVGALALAATDPERLDRIRTAFDPMQDFLGTGWQPAHGLYAMASGGVFGQGIGASRQKWGTLPEAHTDFIFAVLGEELGLAGTVLVIGLFLTLAFAALRIARHTADPFVRYASFGIVVWLLGQMMINIGMVLAMLPVIGIPLPLVSYGGSSLVPTLAALGLLIGFARREPEAARALAQRPHRRRPRSVGLAARR
ncbi:putative lipid II flippase FtsW [Nocardioides sp.]|uniref:putative lipid II flippase FtsW n=1 Tax=Nocardioides sp. TaxID=35761 RepID=UPI003512BEE3